MTVKFLYDLKRKEVKIESEYYNNIREAFSVKNPSARFNRYARFIPQRMYAITPAGYCGIGLVPEIINYLKNLNIPHTVSYNTELENLLRNVSYIRYNRIVLFNIVICWYWIVFITFPHN